MCMYACMCMHPAHLQQAHVQPVEQRGTAKPLAANSRHELGKNGEHEFELRKANLQLRY